MKILKNVFRVLTAILAVAILAAFFVVPFVSINAVGANGTAGTVDVTGAQLAFGSDVSGDLGYASGLVTVFKSGWYFISFILTALTVLFVGLSFKFPKNNWSALITGVLNGILLAVLTFSNARSYVDYGRLQIAGGGIQNTKWLLGTFIAGIAFIVVIIAAILISDKVEVMESKGAKKTIIKRIFTFFREYKSEIKKIVWPNGRTVVKNTIVVLVMCALVLILVWLVDLGMGELFKLVFGGDTSSVAESAAAVASTVTSTVG